MPKLNRGGLIEGLTEFLGIKGERVDARLEDGILPAIVMRDLSASPYLGDCLPIGEFLTQPAVVAEFGYMWAQPGQQSILQLTHLTLANFNAAAMNFNIVQFAAADIAAIVADQFIRFRSLRASPDFNNVAADIARGSDVSAAIGQIVDTVQVPANNTFLYPIPGPGIIIRERGQAAIGVSGGTANAILSVGFRGAQWPLPG